MRTSTPLVLYFTGLTGDLNRFWVLPCFVALHEKVLIRFSACYLVSMLHESQYGQQFMVSIASASFFLLTRFFYIFYEPGF